MNDQTVATLTPAEAEEFTLLNAAAYDLYRVSSKQKGHVPPCWLCMSAEAKTEARGNLLKFMDEKAPNLTGWTEQGLSNYLESVPNLKQLIDRWREAEVNMKTEREKGNPRAFFAS